MPLGQLEWTRKSCEPKDFFPGCNIGIQTGRLSGDLVCVDIDSQDALDLADDYLPATGMIEGRPGKPRSHRRYRVINIPPGFTSTAAGGIGGPKTRYFRRRDDNKSIVDFLGTGSQAAVPPSVWTSKDKRKQEIRVWEVFEEPAVVDFQELFDAVCRLAKACGWKPKQEQKKQPQTKKNKASGEIPEKLPIPPGEAASQARVYIAAMPPAIEGQGGDLLTFTVACYLIRDFGLTIEEALPLLLEYNERCQPPWTQKDLIHKLEEVEATSKEQVRGQKVRPSNRRIEVKVQPEDKDIFLGVACAGDNRSYIQLSSMGAAILKLGKKRHLAAELEALSWEDKYVLLTPPSTISTNSQEVWVEFFLARLLRERGATVQSVRYLSFEGRKRTFAEASGEIEIINPPETGDQANALAKSASEKAEELDKYRKSLPRKSKSPKLEKAMAFVEQNNITHMTKDVIKQAKRKGIKQTTLGKAIQWYNTYLNTFSPPSLCNITLNSEREDDAASI